MQQDVKGVRKRGQMYQYNVSYQGRRITGTVPTVVEAVQARTEVLRGLREEIRAEIDAVRVKTEDRTVPMPAPAEATTRSSSRKVRNLARVKTLQTVFDVTIETRWAGTKGEATARINGRLAVEFFGERTHIADITSERVREYIGYLESIGNKGSTINRKISALSTILRTAEEYGYIDRAPIIRRKKEYNGRERFITPNEEGQMLEILEGWGATDFRDAIIILIDTGFRCGELLRLEKEDVCKVEGRWIVKALETKTNEARGVPLTKRAEEVMLRRVNDMPGKRLFPYERSWIRGLWERLRAQMGLIEDPQFVPHILRHTCASRLVQRGVPLPQVKLWMGHKSLQSTMRYSHLAPTSLFHVVDALEKME